MMSDFQSTYTDLQFESTELAEQLLSDAGQFSNGVATSPDDLLLYLNLQQLTFHWWEILPVNAKNGAAGLPPLALLDFRERLIAVDADMSERRQRFGIFHEIGHYVLPMHRKLLYLCDGSDLGPNTLRSLEKEANDFSADLLFKGDLFTEEANSMSASGRTIKTLGDKYLASYEATARRFVEKNSSPLLLVVFRKLKPEKASTEAGNWAVGYCIPSASFRARYFTGITGSLPFDVEQALTDGWIGIENSVSYMMPIESANGEVQSFGAEFFTNSYSVFGVLSPTEQ